MVQKCWLVKALVKEFKSAVEKQSAIDLVNISIFM